ncbi:MAG: hypothetical protein EPO07_13045 [Verrucomicrobia bacterium]|nr:MAG: hypothetical protein EPO07_13045 [Verrucomicrobiota bacterium]
MKRLAATILSVMIAIQAIVFAPAVAASRAPAKSCCGCDCTQMKCCKPDADASHSTPLAPPSAGSLKNFSAFNSQSVAWLLPASTPASVFVVEHLSSVSADQPLHSRLCVLLI